MSDIIIAGHAAGTITVYFSSESAVEFASELLGRNMPLNTVTEISHGDAHRLVGAANNRFSIERVEH
jgi:hypothetical protein